MNKEKQIVKLSCSPVRNGTNNRYREELVMEDDAVSSLMELRGRKVTVSLQKDSYCYMGEDDPEEQSHIGETLSGKVLSVGKTGIRLDVESGEITGDLGSSPVKLGEMDIPFSRNDYAFQQDRTILAIQDIVSSDIAYRPICQ